MWRKSKSGPDGIAIIGSALDAVAAKAAEKGGENAGAFVEALLKGSVFAGAATFASPLWGVALSSIISALLKQADSSDKMVAALVSEPYKTGVRELSNALRLPPSEFRANALRFANQKLQSALTLVYDIGETDQIVFVLSLLALSESLLPDGAPSASIRATDLIELLSKEINLITEKLDLIGLRERVPDDEAYWNKQHRYPQYKHEIGEEYQTPDLYKSIGPLSFSIDPLSGAKLKKHVIEINHEKTKRRLPLTAKRKRLINIRSMFHNFRSSLGCSNVLKADAGIGVQHDCETPILLIESAFQVAKKP